MLVAASPVTVMVNEFVFKDKVTPVLMKVVVVTDGVGAIPPIQVITPELLYKYALLKLINPNSVPFCILKDPCKLKIYPSPGFKVNSVDIDGYPINIEVGVALVVCVEYITIPYCPKDLYPTPPLTEDLVHSAKCDADAPDPPAWAVSAPIILLIYPSTCDKGEFFIIFKLPSACAED